MPSKYLEPEERCVRYVPWGKLLKDEDDVVLGTLGVAFHLREDEDYLSVTWCEYFQGGNDDGLRCAAEAIRASELDVRPKGHFAVASVASIGSFMKAGGRKLRFIHEKAPDNPAHAAIRGWSNDDLELLDRLAEDVWSQVYSKDDIDAIPQTACDVSARGGLAP